MVGWIGLIEWNGTGGTEGREGTEGTDGSDGLDGSDGSHGPGGSHGSNGSIAIIVFDQLMHPPAFGACFYEGVSQSFSLFWIL